MYETPETGYHIANCDYCGEETEMHCDWAAFQQTLKAEGWAIVRGKRCGQMTLHICPACKAEGIAVE